MAASKDLSLGELETLYQTKISRWTDRRAQLTTELAKCDQQLRTYQEKLRWVRTLITSPEGSMPAPAPSQRRRRRRSPVKELCLEILRARPGQWLTAAQVRTAIRKDTNKRVSRQSVNVNLNLLEKTSRIRRRPAPKGSGGARYVFSVT